MSLFLWNKKQKKNTEHYKMSWNCLTNFPETLNSLHIIRVLLLLWHTHKIRIFVLTVLFYTNNYLFNLPVIWIFLFVVSSLFSVYTFLGKGDNCSKNYLKIINNPRKVTHIYRSWCTVLRSSIKRLMSLCNGNFEQSNRCCKHFVHVADDL